jgi:hypothetical protein
MTAPPTLLTVADRRAILAVIEEAARDIYPELDVPYLDALRAAREPMEPMDLGGGLPHEVSKRRAGRDRGCRSPSP